MHSRPACDSQLLQRLSSTKVPERHCPVPVTRCQLLTIRRKNERMHAIAIPKRSLCVQSKTVEESYRLTIRNCQGPSVRREPDRLDLVAAGDGSFVGVADAQEANFAGATDCQRGVVGRKGSRVDARSPARPS